MCHFDVDEKQFYPFGRGARSLVTEQIMDEKLWRMVTRVLLSRVVMHLPYHYGVHYIMFFSSFN
ncbi:hypothetical protein HanRHA438_Chr16g0786801 [Helianthus annuus]|nr:hypothetical protein HanXRQr2_Chr16g0775991 [Helianthus annuus]KAJ0440112.1 hypothetical protein HanHA300_Chr16g0632811 [Helianthus annuus]KAJ0462493.1 hypothetical protein HanHA89_Chr16g0683981 [Helianthus annuus]KAJ0642893.1 hypothetical protein HanLR1_Chr16g0643391 [Helianthus annuus]KAJ0646755.1 hypothetical protein HanOQP8_Chr16g0638681 [Helianthus annuus]